MEIKKCANQKIIKPKIGLLELLRALVVYHQHVKRWDIVETVITDLKNCMKHSSEEALYKLVIESQ